MRKIAWLSLIILIGLTSACTTTAAPTPTSVVVPTLAPTTAPTKSPTAAPTVSHVIQPTAAPTVSAAEVDVAGTRYIDDRSSAERLVVSYYNAINRHEYARAYGYWSSAATPALPAYTAFEDSFGDVNSVNVWLGPITRDAGAGQYYSSVPAGVTLNMSDGTTAQYTTCLVTHLSSPGAQGVLPFRPMYIERGEQVTLPAGADLAETAANACVVSGDAAGSPVEITATPDPADISAARYLDDRSDALQVLRSYYNAVNLHEYVRAYSYWDDSVASAHLSTLDDFIAGYETTQSVSMTAGDVMEEGAAGQLYAKIPVTLVSTTTGGTQTYVACYTMHMANPGFQMEPPFRPMSIYDAVVKTVPAGGNAAALMTTICN